jgi:ssDNA-binding Zn-finger/Zn-ribbon topoisomerase 1
MSDENNHFDYINEDHDYYDACPKCGHPMVYIKFPSGTKYMCNNTGCE